jgi:hypothetical protein
MKQMRFSRPSPAYAVSIMALVAALAGTAIAADSARTPMISKSKTKDIARNQANKAVDNFAEDTLPIGAGDLDEIDEHSQTVNIPVNTNGTAEVSCDSQEQVISGGWRDNAPPTASDLALVYEDHRTSNGWRASVRAFGSARTITVFAYCLEP